MDTRTAVVVILSALVIAAAILVAAWQIASSVQALCGPATGGCIVGGAAR